jgi:hypothetical protein
MYVGLTDLKFLLQFLDEKTLPKFLYFLDTQKHRDKKTTRFQSLDFLQEFYSKTLEKIREMDLACDENFFDYE